MTGRFAPTPSGRMHLGNAFAALLCWLSVRAQGGRMLLRMENLDPLRTSEVFADSIMDDLHWLGLDWDQRVPDQLDRTPFYEEQLAKLREQNLIYPCFCSRAQLHAAEAPHGSDGSYVYDGRCLLLSPAEAAALAQNRGAAVRVRVPNAVVALQDGLQGHYEENLARDCGDFILRRSDGVFAYQLAAPADDGAQGMTEVVRGRDLLPSAPRQIWLMETLGYVPPVYVHLPMMLAPDGRRLAKRDADLGLDAIRAKRKDPRPLIGRLAYLAGLTPEDTPATAADLVAGFGWDKVHKTDITLDEKTMEGNF